MVKNVLNELFIKNYISHNVLLNIKLYEDIINDDNLEQALRNYIERTIVYKTNYMDNLKEIEIAFENIILNSKKYTNNLIGNLPMVIEKYTNDYISLLDNHPLTKIFIESINKLNSSNFDIKDATEDIKKIREINIAVRHRDKSFELIKVNRPNEDIYPSIFINNIDSFESQLNRLIESIKTSDSFYNIFNRDMFNTLSDEEKIKMIFDGILLNLTNMDSLNVEQFIKNYIDYLNDNTFDNIRKPTYITNIFDDELYIMSKKSELWYETPFYISLMLRNKMIELPNVRLGISNNNGKKVANILATQSSQHINNFDIYNELQNYIKESIPSDSYYRFINPTHLISLVIIFGFLKGLGIEDIIVKDYMPYRYKKVINDKQFSEDEGYNYQTRLTTKNLTTYMRIVSNLEGINIEAYPEHGIELKLKITDNVVGKNDFINSLYYTGYNFAKSITKEKSK